MNVPNTTPPGHGKPSLLNALKNAMRPSYLPVMAKKVLKRAEPDHRSEARSWAQRSAIRVDEYCRVVDDELWQETADVGARLRAEGSATLAQLGVDLGGGGAYTLLYFFARRLRPQVVVETGVAAGWSSWALLEALRTNGSGALYSSDFPYFRLPNPEQYVGVLVPPDLRRGWHLDTRGDQKALPAIAASVNSIDLFHFDSDKSVSGRAFAIDTVTPLLSADAVVVMDDIQDNLFFRDWTTLAEKNPTIFEFGGKYLGAVGL